MLIRRLAMGVVVMLICTIATSPAFAKHHHKKHHYKNTHIAYSDEQIVSHPAGCPSHAFCGCGTSVKVFGHPVRELYLAANWLKFPRAFPAPGMVAVFGRHHVAYIMQVDANGNALLYDPNSGYHQTRIHTRDISHATIVNPQRMSDKVRDNKLRLEISMVQ